jgi:chemotaxis receptor (MCP) glutamine deamidase CheD
MDWRKQSPFILGGVHASQEALLIKTLLGSCIAVCLFDPSNRVGGMNHFMLPHGRCRNGDREATRFGAYAMDRLVAAVMKAGGDRGRLIAKVFGAAHVLGIFESKSSVPQQNIAFIQSYLKREGFPVAAEDLGGYDPRDVRFHTGTGQAFVRKVPTAWRKLLTREKIAEAKPCVYGDVTLFVPEAGIRSEGSDQKAELRRQKTDDGSHGSEVGDRRATVDSI